MLLSLSLCWLGTGAWLLADTRRLQRLWPLEPSSQRSSSLRALGLALLLLAAAPLVRREGLALGSVALLLVLMTTLSLAVLLFPLRPRWYAVTLALAAVLSVGATLA
ncbi:MAG: hypothetical protein RL685_3879 [Pseudomonadota bacterium]|jgi:hypothetical protein